VNRSPTFCQAKETLTSLDSQTTHDDFSYENRFACRTSLGRLEGTQTKKGICYATDRFSYGPWGAPRDAITWDAKLPSDRWENDDFAVDRGFTGHRMLDGFRLIHMNGRIYDPMVGRFLSPDIVVQFPGFLQSHNRYSYILNNPLSGTDPSGQFIDPISPLAIAIAFVSASVLTVQAYIASKEHEGFDFWAAIGKGYVQIGLSTFMSWYIGGHIGAFADSMEVAWEVVELTRATLHGLNQGVISEIAGGDFRSGFIGGFFGSLFTHSIEHMNPNRGLDFTLTVLAGGTASALSGGSFANGAISSAMQWLFNQDQNAGEAVGEEDEVALIRSDRDDCVVLYDNGDPEERELNRSMALDLTGGDENRIVPVDDGNFRMAALNARIAAELYGPDGKVTRFYVISHGNSGGMVFTVDPDAFLSSQKYADVEANNRGFEYLGQGLREGGDIVALSCRIGNNQRYLDLAGQTAGARIWGSTINITSSYDGYRSYWTPNLDNRDVWKHSR